MRNKKRAINKKIFALIFLALFLFPLSDVFAAGCCIKDQSKETPDPLNCEKNVASIPACTGTKPAFLAGDPDCTGSISKSYCDTSYDPIGCCVMDRSKSGSSNCKSNVKKSQCLLPKQHDVSDSDCKKALTDSAYNEYCKGSDTPPGSKTCTGLVPCGCKDGPKCNLCYLIVGIKGLVDYGFRIMVFVALVMIVIGGIMYITSAGNEGLMKSAKSVLFKTLAGFAIILGGWLIVNTIIYYIGASSDISGTLRLGGNKWGEFKCDK